MDKLIISACICGAEVTKENNPAVPYTVEEVVREAKSAYDAGAALIHLHVRWDAAAMKNGPLTNWSCGGCPIRQCDKGERDSPGVHEAEASRQRSLPQVQGIPADEKRKSGCFCCLSGLSGVMGKLGFQVFKSRQINWEAYAQKLEAL